MTEERLLPTSLLMFIAYRAAEDRIVAAVAAAGHADLTRAQGRLLAGMDPEGTRVALLAERARIAKQTATSLIDHVERAGYVERVPDPSDLRGRLVRFTDRGRSVIPVARAAEAEVEAEWANHLGPRRAAQLRAALEDLRTITDPYAE